MGYTFTVGNAVPVFHKDDFPHLSAEWQVEHKELDSAPTFHNDALTGKSNSRSPSYSTWYDFTISTGLKVFFYDEQNRLHASHPGCIGFTKEDADLVTALLNKYKANSTLPPGFEGWNYK